MIARDDLLGRLRARIQRHGLAATARAMGVSMTHLGDVAAGRRTPGPKILRGMGMMRVIRYAPAPTVPRETEKVVSPSVGPGARATKDAE